MIYFVWKSLNKLMTLPCIEDRKESGHVLEIDHFVLLFKGIRETYIIINTRNVAL